MKPAARLFAAALSATLVVTAAAPVFAQSTTLRTHILNRTSGALDENPRTEVGPFPFSSPTFGMLRVPIENGSLRNTFATIMGVGPNTVMLETTNGTTVGLRIPNPAIKRMHLRKGGRVHLAMLPHNRFKLQVIR